MSNIVTLIPPKGPREPLDGRIKVMVIYDLGTREIIMNQFAQIRSGEDKGKFMINPLPEIFGLAGCDDDGTSTTPPIADTT